MSELMLREYNSKTIRQREDGYLSATDMCTAGGKLFGDWQRLKATNDYLQTLQPVMGIPITELIQVIQGGIPQNQGTWIHPDVAIELARWISPAFAVQANQWIKEILTKGFASVKPMSPAEMLVAQAQMLLKIEQEQARQAQEIAEMKQLLHQHDGEIDRIFSPNGGYMSIMAYFKAYFGQAIDLRTAAKIGSRCTKYCKSNGIEIQKLKDPRFGTVNAYPEQIIGMFC
jgi:hypothetical protein